MKKKKLKEILLPEEVQKVLKDRRTAAQRAQEEMNLICQTVLQFKKLKNGRYSLSPDLTRLIELPQDLSKEGSGGQVAAEVKK